MGLRILFVTNMYPHAEDLSSGSFVQQQAEGLRRLGHTVDVLHILGYRSVLHYATAAIRVPKRTWRTKYDIVHAHYGLCAAPALFRWKTPLVVTLHGSDALVGKVQPYISRFACRFADATIVVSRKIASRIPGHIIPCGVDLEVFKPIQMEDARKKLRLPVHKRLILFPFSPQRKVKRYDLAKAVTDNLIADGLDVELLVVSGKPNSVMPLYYSASDLMILCSDSEGSPTSVKESLACNTPVLSTHVGDIPDLASEVSCIMLCPQHVQCLVESVRHMLLTNTKSTCNARPSIRRFGQEVVAESIVEIYKTILRDRH